jgi:arginase
VDEVGRVKTTIVQVPYDLGRADRMGAGVPVLAETLAELADETVVVARGDASLNEVAACMEIVRGVGERVREVVAARRFPLVLAGNCHSSLGTVAGLQIPVGVVWLDAHADFNTPETTRSGSLGGMPVAVATGRALHRMRLDAHLDPPLADSEVVMGGVRLTDPLEQELLDKSAIQQVSVDDLRGATPAVFAQLDRLSRTTDKIYVHIDMDVLDPREVEGHQNKVPNGPSSEELARLFEMIFTRYAKASAIGFATIPATDSGGLSLAAVNRMIEGALRGVSAREARRR